MQKLIVSKGRGAHSSPERLANLYYMGGEPDIAFYRKQWVKISHKFLRIVPSPSYQDSGVVSFTGGWPFLGARFESNKWKDILLRFVEGQTINAACQIDLNKSDTGVVRFEGYNCELVDWP